MSAASLFGALLGGGDEFLQSLDLLFPSFPGNRSGIDYTRISRPPIQFTIGLRGCFWAGWRGGWRCLRYGCDRLGLRGLRRRFGRDHGRCGRCRFCCGAGVAVLAAALDDHVHAFFIFLDDRQRAARGLQ